jgi:hypothetical protein
MYDLLSFDIVRIIFYMYYNKILKVLPTAWGILRAIRGATNNR